MNADELMTLIWDYGDAHALANDTSVDRLIHERAEKARGELLDRIRTAVHELADNGKTAAYSRISEYIDDLMARADRTPGVGYGVVLANIRAHVKRCSQTSSAPPAEGFTTETQWGSRKSDGSLEVWDGDEQTARAYAALSLGRRLIKRTVYLGPTEDAE